MNRTRKNPLTRPEHEAFGRELKAMRDRLQVMTCDLATHYPKTSKTAGKAFAAAHALDALRCQLDNQAVQDLAGEFDTRAYFPGPQDATPADEGPVLRCLADIAPADPQVMARGESNYRRGYAHGACAALKAFEMNAGFAAVRSWIDRLMAWRFRDTDRLIIAPAEPVGQRRATQPRRLR